MKKRFFLSVLLLIGVLAVASSCTCTQPFDEFEPEEGLVDVQTQTQGDPEMTTHQYMLASQKRIKPIAQFIPDEAAFYDVPNDCFESYIMDNKVLNRLLKMELSDLNGKSVEITENIEGIFKCIEQLEHDLWRIRIIKSGELYFVYVELNVNLWSPCALYFYNSAEKRLVELYTWDGQEVIALHVRSIEGLLAL